MCLSTLIILKAWLEATQAAHSSAYLTCYSISVRILILNPYGRWGGGIFEGDLDLDLIGDIAYVLPLHTIKNDVLSLRARLLEQEKRREQASMKKQVEGLTFIYVDFFLKILSTNLIYMLYTDQSH